MSDNLPTITVYTRPLCGYCRAAKQLLDSNDYEFEEIRLDQKPELTEQVMLKAGQRTVPQIFVGEQPIGGFTELHQQISSGEFAELVQTLSGT